MFFNPVLGNDFFFYWPNFPEPNQKIVDNKFFNKLRRPTLLDFYFRKNYPKRTVYCLIMCYIHQL